MKINLDGIHGYIQLCAAIVNSGIKQNDKEFLKSEWCSMLTNYVIDYNKHITKSMNVTLLIPKGTGLHDR